MKFSMEDNNVYVTFDIRNFPSELVSVFIIFLIIYMVILSVEKVFSIVEKSRKIYYYEL